MLFLSKKAKRIPSLTDKQKKLKLEWVKEKQSSYIKKLDEMIFKD